MTNIRKVCILLGGGGVCFVRRTCKYTCDLIFWSLTWSPWRQLSLRFYTDFLRSFCLYRQLVYVYTWSTIYDELCWANSLNKFFLMAECVRRSFLFKGEKKRANLFTCIDFPSFFKYYFDCCIHDFWALQIGLYIRKGSFCWPDFVPSVMRQPIVCGLAKGGKGCTFSSIWIFNLFFLARVSLLICLRSAYSCCVFLALVAHSNLQTWRERKKSIGRLSLYEASSKRDSRSRWNCNSAQNVNVKRWIER